MRQLDCLIISTGRAASTATYQYLNAVGELNLPANKEPHHWCSLSRYEGRYAMLDDIHIADDHAYEQLYRNSRMMIDASVGYFFCIDEVIGNLTARSQDPPVIFLYRDPVSRAISLFNELRAKGIEDAGSPEAAIELANRRPQGLWWENYYDNVPYDTVYRKVRKHFSRVLTVDYRTFAESPAESIRRMAAFVGIDCVGRLYARPINSSAEITVAGRLKKFAWAARLLPPKVVKQLKSFATRVVEIGTPFYDVDPEVRAPNLAKLLPLSLHEFDALVSRLETGRNSTTGTV